MRFESFLPFCISSWTCLLPALLYVLRFEFYRFFTLARTLCIFPLVHVPPSAKPALLNGLNRGGRPTKQTKKVGY